MCRSCISKDHAPIRGVEQPNNAQIDLLQQPNVVEYEQPNIVDNNVDLQVINQHDVGMELEEEQTSSKQARTVPEWLINTLCIANSHSLL